MDTNELVRDLGYGFLGLVAGAIGGLLGIGGAVIIIPTLVFIFGFSQMRAQGTTLLLLVPPIGLLAALQYYRAGEADLKAAIIIAALFFVGGFFGAKVAALLDPSLLRKLFALFLAGISVKMFFG